MKVAYLFIFFLVLYTVWVYTPNVLGRYVTVPKLLMFVLMSLLVIASGLLVIFG